MEKTSKEKERIDKDLKVEKVSMWSGWPGRREEKLTFE